MRIRWTSGRPLLLCGSFPISELLLSALAYAICLTPAALYRGASSHGLGFGKARPILAEGGY